MEESTGGNPAGIMQQSDDSRAYHAFQTYQAEKQWATLPEILRTIAQIDRDFDAHTFDHFVPHPATADERVIQGLQQKLEERGIKRMAYLGHGSYTVTLDLGKDGTVARLDSSCLHKNTRLGEVLQPDWFIEEGGLRFAQARRLVTDLKLIRPEHLLLLITSLAHKNFKLPYPALSEVGLLTPEIPLLLNDHSIERMLVPPIEKPHYLHYLANEYGTLPTKFPDFAGAQREAAEKLGIPSVFSNAASLQGRSWQDNVHPPASQRSAGRG